MIASGILLKDHAPNEEAMEASPSDFESPTPECRAKNIHNELTFNANGDQFLQWGTPDSQIIQPISRGSGISIMVSDFIILMFTRSLEVYIGSCSSILSSQSLMEN